MATPRGFEPPTLRLGISEDGVSFHIDRELPARLRGMRSLDVNPIAATLVACYITLHITQICNLSVTLEVCGAPETAYAPDGRTDAQAGQGAGRLFRQKHAGVCSAGVVLRREKLGPHDPNSGIIE